MRGKRQSSLSPFFKKGPSSLFLPFLNRHSASANVGALEKIAVPPPQTVHELLASC